MSWLAQKTDIESCRVEVTPIKPYNEHEGFKKPEIYDCMLKSWARVLENFGENSENENPGGSVESNRPQMSKIAQKLSVFLGKNLGKKVKTLDSSFKKIQF